MCVCLITGGEENCCSMPGPCTARSYQVVCVVGGCVCMRVHVCVVYGGSVHVREHACMYACVCVVSVCV